MPKVDLSNKGIDLAAIRNLSALDRLKIREKPFPEGDISDENAINSIRLANKKALFVLDFIIKEVIEDRQLDFFRGVRKYLTRRYAY